jgi:glycosyltransferase involved in cell wall biosynthesis
MRIAIVAPPWVGVPPPAYGGTELVLDNLARGLAERDHEILLFATGDSTCPVPTEWVYETAIGTGMARPAAELRQVIAAYDAALAWGVDIVHDHTLMGPFYSARFPGLPVVTTNHGPFSSELWPLYANLPAEVALVAISHDQASARADIPIAAVIHHGVDPAQFQVGPGGEHAVFLGRMCPEKGVVDAIRIARAAGIPLRIAAKMSEREEKEYFERCVRPLLGRDIEYVGEVGGADKWALLAGARCLLNPIRWSEPFGMVMIEALACGTPVIAAPIGAAPEIVEHGVIGWLADDDRSFVRAVRSADELDRTACRRAVEERFSHLRMAADHERLYGELLVTAA